ncbi:MAG: glycosyltransferase [Acidobacteria bacterium]|nr:MAG: glycosyltransferase [Acidobacteriota bacterium]REK08812.1 MAG: glycosyltransferase [Acidobacteriota bacterium]
MISLIIPAFDESRLLPRLLDTVDRARQSYEGGADGVEVIVADNASTDDTAVVAEARGCIVVPVARRLIAAARNGGAAVARGDVLCFVDADMRIHPETFNAVAAAMDDERFVAGATGVRLERWSPGIALTYAVIVPMVWATRMDTGAVFCRRADFDRIGGYDERRELAEDVAFLLALRRVGKRRGQRLVRLRGAKALASMRKFDEHGDWHYFTRIMPLAVPALLWPERRSALAKRYWYPDER